MRRTPIELAAIASAAVPGLAPTAVAPEPDDAADFESAVLFDADRKRWRVRSPKHAEASTRLETELLVLRVFTPAIRAELPFLMPTVAGTVRQGDLTTFVYAHLSGRPAPVEELIAGGASVAREVGAAMAAIHDLPADIVRNADLPSYTANEFRQRRLNELDQAATTGKIPASLLRRWEHALEDVALWKFSPCAVHGDLHEDNLLIDNGRVAAITGWTDLRIGDPADDLAWLVALHDADFVNQVREAYAAARKEQPDRHLMRRAALSAEFALAQWLVKGVATDNAKMVAEGEEMLRTLEHDIEAYGGQPVSTDPEPAAPATVPAPGIPAAPATAPAGTAATSTPGTGSTAVGSSVIGSTAAGSRATGSTAVTVEPVPDVDDIAEPDVPVEASTPAPEPEPAPETAAAEAAAEASAEVGPQPDPHSPQKRGTDAPDASGGMDASEAAQRKADDTATTNIKVIPL